MARQTMSISLPVEMVHQVDKARKKEHRTRSELIREALRVYLGTTRALRTYLPTAAELRSIDEGRAEIRRGEYFTLDEIRPAVASHRRPASRKKPRSRPGS